MNRPTRFRLVSRPATGLALSALLLLTATSMTGGAGATTVAGPTPTLSPVFDYEFGGSTGTVANSSVSGPALTMTLVGSWSLGATGVRFGGDSSGQQSVGFAAPTTGDTIDVSPARSIGVGVRTYYRAPTSGQCFSDTPNITQIGRYAADAAEAKIQLSKCANSTTKVFMACRMAGSLTAVSVEPIISTLALHDRHSYNVRCIKGRDRAGTTTAVTLRVTDLDAKHGPKTVTNHFQVASVGTMETEDAVSAGNKYPLPAPQDNTDQYVGGITRVVYCIGAHAAVRGCLTASLPARPPRVKRP